MASSQILDNGIEFLCTAFDKRIDEDRRKIYASLLADLPDDVFKAAVKHCAATNTFFPVPGEIRAAAAYLGKLSQCVPTADEAWSELVNRAHAPRQSLQVCHECYRLETENQRLVKAIETAIWNRQPEVHDALLIELNQVMRQQHARRSCPDCKTLVTEYQFSHPLVAEVARRLGWPERFWSNEIGVDRGRFIKTYEAHISHLTDEAVLLPVVRDYVDQQQKLLTDDRHAVFERGEKQEISSQIRRLTFSMEK